MDDLSPEQLVLARAIIDTVDHNSKQLIFFQGSAGTGKTHIVRVILSELQKKERLCLISVAIGIAFVQ
jgi:chromosomal replication initiation ATPase DnaA